MIKKNGEIQRSNMIAMNNAEVLSSFFNESTEKDKKIESPTLS